MGIKDYLIINYECKQKSSHVLPFLIKDISNIKEIIFNGEKIKHFNIELIENFNLISIDEKPNNGLNSLIIVLNKKSYNIGLVDDECTDISFNNSIFNNELYKNIMLDFSNLNVEKLNDKSFFNLKNLISLKTSKNLSYIGDNCFIGCDNLTRLIFNTQFAPKLGICVFGYEDNRCAGRNTYSLGVNKLYLINDAKNYDQGDWSNILLNKDKCGFIIDSHWGFKNF